MAGVFAGHRDLEFVITSHNPGVVAMLRHPSVLASLGLEGEAGGGGGPWSSHSCPGTASDDVNRYGSDSQCTIGLGCRRQPHGRCVCLCGTFTLPVRWHFSYFPSVLL